MAIIVIETQRVEPPYEGMASDPFAMSSLAQLVSEFIAADYCRLSYALGAMTTPMGLDCGAIVRQTRGKRT